MSRSATSKRYSEITGTIQTGYFTLRPREEEKGFERADGAHQEILGWIKGSKESVLYLTGASGTGKSSLLSAWVIPKLRRDNYVVVQLRGSEDDLFERIEKSLLAPGLIWDKVPGKFDDIQSLSRRVAQRLAEKKRRLLLIFDQFEEFLILAENKERKTFQRLLPEKPIDGLTFLLVFRPEYEGLIQEQSWPKLQLDTNRRVVSPFTENAAHEFIRKSGLQVNAELMRAVLREAADIEQTVGLIRPVTVNLCGLVLGRFSSGLPRRFRGGVIRGFLRESLSLPEARDVARKLIPELISDNVTKRPRTIAALTQATSLGSSTVHAFLRRLGESDRAIVRPLDQRQETWEISHDFLVPLLDSIVARRTVSLWRWSRPWLPWAATALMAVAAASILSIRSENPRALLTAQGWTVGEDRGTLRVARAHPVPPQSIRILNGISLPLWVDLVGGEITDVSLLRGLQNVRVLGINSPNVTDVSALSEMKNLTWLNLSNSGVADISPLRGLKNLTMLDLTSTRVADVSPLQELRNLKQLHLSGTEVADLSPLRKLSNLEALDVTATNVKDLSPLWGLTSLRSLNLVNTRVRDLSGLRELGNLQELRLDHDTNVTDQSGWRELKSLTSIGLDATGVTDVAALGKMTNLLSLDLGETKVTDISALRDLKNLTSLLLVSTNVKDISVLRALRNLQTLSLASTGVTNLSALRELKSLRRLILGLTKVADVSPLRELSNLEELDLSNTNVTDVSALHELKHLTYLNLAGTKVTDVSALRELSHLRIIR